MADWARGGDWNRHKEEVMLLEYEEEQSVTRVSLTVEEREQESFKVGCRLVETNRGKRAKSPSK